MSRIDAHEAEFGPRIVLGRNGGGEVDRYGMQDQRGSGGSAAGFGTFGPTPRYQSEREYGSGASGGGGMGSIGGREDWMRMNRRMAFGSYSSASSPPLPTSPPPPAAPSRSCVWWGELEPWMDEEYAKQVCNLMRWDPVSIKVPQPGPEAPHANNPGYCFLTFPSPAHAASVLAQVAGNNITMPNSSKPFVLNWASSIPAATTTPPAPIHSFPQTTPAAPHLQPQSQQYPKEYSIFVGDLAPETSNSDLVAVFRNPVLGLRNDREPKFIRPFTSCKSAKIMLDPVTGVSRGYGFVRFTDEADQQRALIEMHGLYCLSRPMRISPATAKYKPPASISAMDLPQVQFPPQVGGGNFEQPITLALPLPNSNQPKSIPAPIAVTPASSSTNSVPSSASTSSVSVGSQSTNSLSSTSTSQSSASSASSTYTLNPSEDLLNLPNNVLAQIAQQYANGTTPSVKPTPGMSITAPFAQDVQQQALGNSGNAPRYMISEESWKHHAQARAILGNLIGPNGEQLTSTDPYNTTVFVGGLSPLISEETLRTFFAPFGDIHYVKVPIGKHCGFVQFVRKADAERAIEKMQGFPVGGSRIRLSWGRSQYKAAQAAAQAAQTAALQSHFSTTPTSASFMGSVPPGSSMGADQGGAPLTQEQAMRLLQKLSLQGYFNPSTTGTGNGSVPNRGNNGVGNFNEERLRSAVLAHSDEGPLPFEAYSAAFGAHPTSDPSLPDVGPHQGLNQQRPQISAFSPFSPDPNVFNPTHSNGFPVQSIFNPHSATFSPPQGLQNKRRDSASMFPGPPGTYSAPFYPQTLDTSMNISRDGNGPSSRMSPGGGTRPSSATRYGPFLDGSPFSAPLNKGTGTTPISRPASGNRDYEDHNGQEHDLIQDLNGTLASLDLDQVTPQPNRDDQWRKESASSEGFEGPMPLHNSSSISASSP